MRLLRRRSATELQTRDVDLPTLALWARRGYLRRNDLVAVTHRGTLAVAELPELAADLAVATRRGARDAAIAVALAGGAGAAFGLGGPAGVVVAVPALAGFQAWVRSTLARQGAVLSDLPADPATLAAAERRELWTQVVRATRKGVALGAITAAAALPLSAVARGAAAILSAVGVRSWLRHRAPSAGTPKTPGAAAPTP